MAACNNADLRDGSHPASGDPTELALLRLAADYGEDVSLATPDHAGPGQHDPAWPAGYTAHRDAPGGDQPGDDGLCGARAAGPGHRPPPATRRIRGARTARGGRT